MLPFIIEFVLIGAATLYKIMNQIGMPVTQDMLDVKYIPMAEKIKLMARRTILPNIIGWIIMLFTVAGTIYIIYTSENDEDTNKEEETAAYVFFSMQMILNVIGLIAILLIMFYKMHAPFVGHAHSIVDQAVLIVTLFGFYLLLGFNFLPNLESFTEPNFFGTLAKMGTFENISNYIQGSMQFLFIMDAMRRGPQPMWLKTTSLPPFSLRYFSMSMWLCGWYHHFCSRRRQKTA